MQRKHFYILISFLISFLILAAFIVYLEEIPLDNYLFILINQRLAFEGLDPFFLFGARVLVYIPMVPAAWLFLKGDKETRMIIIFMFMVVFFSRIIYETFKSMTGRLRPYDYLEDVRLIVEKRPELSFPSGHATVASVLTTFAFYFRRDKSRYLMILYLLTVAYSRIYVGVHYPLDVVGGILLGVSTSLGFVALYETFSRKFE
ncbi:MAG: phosphatase PAP2 family protein [Halobacteriota archaeon]|nr:phosphatase PAP2 family protein [Halobacteriota archaeon]